MPAQKVISVGTDPELLWLRNAALKSAGFDVESAGHHDHALAAIRRGDCGTLLICSSLQEPIRRVLADAFRRNCPEGRIVEITNQRIQKSDFADSFVYGIERPEALIEAIRRD